MARLSGEGGHLVDSAGGNLAELPCDRRGSSQSGQPPAPGGGRDILVLTSVSIIQALLAAGEVDRIIYHVAPEIVGGGRPLFTDDVPRSSWRLSESQATESGSIYLILDRVED